MKEKYPKIFPNSEIMIGLLERNFSKLTGFHIQFDNMYMSFDCLKYILVSHEWRSHNFQKPKQKNKKKIKKQDTR